jgi:hypothetical protein
MGTRYVTPLDALNAPSHLQNAPRESAAATEHEEGHTSIATRARTLIEGSGIVFPEIPDDLAARLMEQRDWGFTTRTDELAPFAFDEYADELDDPALRDYAILAHDGYGMNSYMMHYYLVKGPLRLLVQLPYGGVYMPEPQTTDYLNVCFQLASEIAREALGGCLSAPGDQLTVLCSMRHGWDWSAMKNGVEYGWNEGDGPKECLEETLTQLKQWDEYQAASEQGVD